MLELPLNPPAVLAAAVLLSFVLSYAALGYSRWRNLIDHPGERHSHQVATPRGGGAGIVSALTISSLTVSSRLDEFWLAAALPATLILALLGWWDDHRSLSARLRFAVQLAVTLGLLAWLSSDIPGLSTVTLVASGLFLLWMTNMYNFMDGSNGMAATQGVFGGLVLAALYFDAAQPGLALASALVAASCLGFLPLNLGRARIFMGDVGSLSLGFVFGSLVVYGVMLDAFSLPVGLLVMSLFLVDAGMTLLRRVLRGERWYTAHKQHLYQRMIAMGRTHGRVLLVYQAINLLVVLPVIWAAVVYPSWAWTMSLALISALAAGWCILTWKIGVAA